MSNNIDDTNFDFDSSAKHFNAPQPPAASEKQPDITTAIPETQALSQAEKEAETVLSENTPTVKTAGADTDASAGSGIGNSYANPKIIRNSSVKGSSLISNAGPKSIVESEYGNKNYNALSKKISAAVQISRSALDAIIENIGSKRPETGGMLIGPIGGDKITHFVFDEEASVSSITYSPSFEELSVLCDIAAEKGYTLKGFCHSHPCGCSQPSYGDMEYVRKFFRENEKLEKFYMPILTGAPIGFEDLKRAVKNDNYSKFINFYTVFRENQYQFYKVNISIEDDNIGDYKKYNPIFPSVILPKSVARIRTGVIENYIGQRGISVEKKSLKLGEIYIGCIIATGAGFEINMLLPTEFPLLPPHIIVAETGGAEYQCAIDNWNIEKNELPEKTLAKIIIGICGGSVKKSVSI